METSKADWKLFREKIGEWQETYMERLNREYIEILSSEKAASEKFWALDDRMKEDKKKPGVILELRKSNTGKVNVGIVLTMNAPQVYYKMSYEKKLKDQINAFRSLNGEVRVLTGCDTRQVKDYSKYNMASFNEKHKIAHHEKQFPLDLDKAFKMGAELCCAETVRA